MSKRLIWRRLLPLYISSFFQGVVFWYAIEKVFMVHIGFTPTTIALQVVVMSVTGLLLEVPSGILADRWSRKGVLVLACLALAFASLILGLSNNVLAYLLASILYGAYFALHSGTYDSMVYDTLIEEQGSRTGYEKYLGYATIFGSVGLVIGSLLGGVLGDKLGLQSTYFLSVPGGILAAIATLFFVEPKIHKAHAQAKILHHTKQTLQVVFQRGLVAWILVTLLATSVTSSFLLEVDQLWPLALNMSLPWYGPLNALLLLGYGMGGTVAAVLVKKRKLLPASYLLAVLAVSLLLIRVMPVIAVAQFTVIVLYMAFYTIALGMLHDVLPSHLRSGSSSVVNTLINLIFIPLIFIFGILTERYTVFRASYMLLPLAIISVIGLYVVSKRGTLAAEANVADRASVIPSTAMGR